MKGLSRFQFTFYLDNEIYEYSFSLDQRQVHEEWLMQLTTKDYEPLFTRFTDENDKTEIEIGPEFAPENSKDQKLADILKESIQENQKNQMFLLR